MLRELLAAHPSAASVATGTGKLPLTMCPQELESFEMLLAAAPGAVSESCVHSCLPLHAACGSSNGGKPKGLSTRMPVLW